ncbi:MAG: hypothetical protein IJ877_03525 [Candidatus Gastranaerophilales bacterium]|nr:hypothetical protein [Candidatus Gastranaerophilales bacterium]
MNKTKHKTPSFLTTAIVTVIVVFVLCFAIQLELLFRCENYVTKHELNMANLVKFATIEQLEKRLQNEPSNYIVSVKLAKLYEGLNEKARANKLYSDAVKKSGRTNYTLYNYALFCAKQGLFAIASGMAEEISGKNTKNIRYKAEIYEKIADVMFEYEEYKGAVSAYQISYKYAKNAQDEKYYNSVKNKYSYSYVKLADSLIEQKMVQEAIVALNNSIKVKETQIAKYKLGLIYIDFDKQKAQKLIEQVFKQEPYLVNPYIYNTLLNDLIDIAMKENNHSAINYYSVKYNSFKLAMEDIYLYKKDIAIDGSEIIKKKDKYYLVFNIKNTTKTKISQLFMDIELYLNSRRYRISKKVVYLSHALFPYGVIMGYKIQLPSNIDIVDVKNHNYLIIKYFAKKRTKAPNTLIKIDSLNF